MPPVAPRPAAAAQPALAGWLRGVPQAETDLLELLKRAPDPHPSAPADLCLLGCLALGSVFSSPLRADAENSRLGSLPYPACSS